MCFLCVSKRQHMFLMTDCLVDGGSGITIYVDSYFCYLSCSQAK